MQIIIVQAEIETAIRNFVLSQLAVREGQRIDIALSATRGEDGFKATIDIVADTEPAAPVKAAPTPAAATTKAEAVVTASRASVQVARQQVINNPPVEQEPAAKEAAPASSPASDASTAGATADSAGTAQTAGEVETLRRALLRPPLRRMLRKQKIRLPRHRPLMSPSRAACSLA